jgi:hypothetical protein
MNKKTIVDIIILAIIGVFISIGIFDNFSNNYILSVNFYLGCITWIIIILFKIYRRRQEYFVFWFLLLLTLNILVCSASIVSFGSVNYLYNDGKLVIGSIGLNPIFSLILIVYSILNYDLIKSLFKNSEKEELEKLELSVRFYYDKFNAYPSEELVDIFKMYKEYSNEAQIALKQIHKERNLSYIEF